MYIPNAQGRSFMSKVSGRIRASASNHTVPVGLPMAKEIIDDLGLFEGWTASQLVPHLRNLREQYDAGDRQHQFQVLMDAARNKFTGERSKLPPRYYELLYDASKRTLSRVNAQVVEKAVAEQDEAGTFSIKAFTDGIKAYFQEHSSANALHPHLQHLVVTTFEDWTREDPDGKRRRAAATKAGGTVEQIAFVFSDPDVNGVPGLYRKALETLADEYDTGTLQKVDGLDGVVENCVIDGKFRPGLLLRYPTFLRRTRAAVKDAGGDAGGWGFLLPFSHDHNCCPVCLNHRHQINEAELELAHATRTLEHLHKTGATTFATLSKAHRAWAEDQEFDVTDGNKGMGVQAAAARVAAQASLDQAKTAKAAHSGLDRAIRSEYKKFVDIGARVSTARLAAAAEQGDSALPDSPGFATVDSCAVLHSDDAAKQDHPVSVLEGALDPMTKYCQSINGGYFLVNDRFVLNLPEQGVGSKDSAFTIDTILMALIFGMQGEKVLVIALDGASTGYTSVVGVYLTMMLVGLGVCESCIVVYFQKYHSKSFCDKMFGAIVSLARNHGIYILEDFAKLCVWFMQRTVGRNFSIVSNPDAMVDHYVRQTSTLSVDHHFPTVSQLRLFLHTCVCLAHCTMPSFHHAKMLLWLRRAVLPARAHAHRMPIGACDTTLCPICAFRGMPAASTTSGRRASRGTPPTRPTLSGFQSPRPSKTPSCSRWSTNTARRGRGWSSCRRARTLTPPTRSCTS